MAKSVLLSPEIRRELLEMLLEEGGGPAAVVKVARRFRASSATLARWITGQGGPFETDRVAVEKVIERRRAAAEPKP